MLLPRIGITLGDPAGIGPEVTAKALASSIFPLERISIIGSRENFLETAARLNIDESTFAGLSFVDVSSPGITAGKWSRASGSVAVQSIEKAAEMASAGLLEGLCTAPISKEAILMAGSRYIDHTTMLQGLTHSENVSTVFETGNLRILFMTKHVPLRRAIDLVKMKNVKESIGLADLALRCLGLERRRIAVASLNPHAGEGGLLGDEEVMEIAPAVAAMKETYDVEGPLPADSVFHQAASGIYDIVVSLYHDQGHIAAKMLDFNGTVSMNIGLPFLRTSVDHGTAFDIAGKGVANDTSMRKAIEKCMNYASNYRAFWKNHGNPR